VSELRRDLGVDCSHEEHLGRSIALAWPADLEAVTICLLSTTQLSTSRSNSQRGYYHKHYHKWYTVKISGTARYYTGLFGMVYNPVIPFRYTDSMPYPPDTERHIMSLGKPWTRGSKETIPGISLHVTAAQIRTVLSSARQLQPRSGLSTASQDVAMQRMIIYGDQIERLPNLSACIYFRSLWLLVCVHWRATS
jgi:hypothetical protein